MDGNKIQNTGWLVGRALVRFLILIILIRLVRDTSFRMLFTFLPVYARGLGITLTAAGVLMMVRTMLGILAPFFGNRADRLGYRPMLMMGFVVMGFGMLIFSFAQGFVVALIAVVLLGIADAMLLPIMQAYVSEQSPPNLRGRSLVTIEYSWAITGILLIPIAGWLITVDSWQTPFRLLAAASFLSVAVLWFFLPRDLARSNVKSGSLGANMKTILADRSALGAILTSAIVFIALESFFITWGAHMEITFDLTASGIGRVALVFGLAELVGSVVASLVIDKVGKRRSVITGIIAAIFALILLPWLGKTLVTSVIALSLVTVAFEFTLVSVIPLLSEQRPGSRATVLAMGALAGTFTRGLTDPTATWLLENRGFLSAMFLGFAALIVALFVVWRWVQDRIET